MSTSGGITSAIRRPSEARCAAGRSPGAAPAFQPAELDEVIMLTRAGQEAARLGSVDVHAGACVEPAGVVGVVTGDQLDQLRIEFDGIDVPGRMVGGLLDGAAAAGAGEGAPPATYFEALSGQLNRGWAPLTGYLQAERKAIRLPLPELYDLQADPAEQDNLAEAEVIGIAAFVIQMGERIDYLQDAEIDGDLALLRELAEIAPRDERILRLAIRAFRPSGDQETLTRLTASLADVCYASGQEDQAKRFYLELVAGDPTNQLYRERLAQLDGVVEGQHPDDLADTTFGLTTQKRSAWSLEILSILALSIRSFEFAYSDRKPWPFYTGFRRIVSEAA